MSSGLEIGAKYFNRRGHIVGPMKQISEERFSGKLWDGSEMLYYKNGRALKGHETDNDLVRVI